MRPARHAMHAKRATGRHRGRHLTSGMTAVELAVTFAVVGIALRGRGSGVPAQLHASKLVEPVDGVKAIAEGATSYAKAHDVFHAYPPSAPLTPAAVPRGTRESGPAGSVGPPFVEGDRVPGHRGGGASRICVRVDASDGPTRSTFTAIAHGDLDGDGVTSTFEVNGHSIRPAGGYR